MRNCVRLSPMKGFFQRSGHLRPRLGVRTVQAEPNHVPDIISHALPHAVLLKPIHRRIYPAISGPLQVGTNQQSLLHRVGPGRHPDHAVAIVIHPV